MIFFTTRIFSLIALCCFLIIPLATLAETPEERQERLHIKGELWGDLLKEEIAEIESEREGPIPPHCWDKYEECKKRRSSECQFRLTPPGVHHRVTEAEKLYCDNSAGISCTFHLKGC